MIFLDFLFDTGPTTWSRWCKYETAMSISSSVIYAIQKNVSVHFRHTVWVLYVMFQSWKAEMVCSLGISVQHRNGEFGDEIYSYYIINARSRSRDGRTWAFAAVYASRTAWTNQPNKVNPRYMRRAVRVGHGRSQWSARQQPFVAQYLTVNNTLFSYPSWYPC